MCNAFRSLLVCWLVLAFIALPQGRAWAGDGNGLPAAQPPVSLGDRMLWQSAVGQLPRENRAMSQVVASTNESKLLVGLIAGTAIVAGLTMLAYGSTSSCKGSFGNDTTSCDRIALLGAVGLGAGAATLILWKIRK